MRGATLYVVVRLCYRDFNPRSSCEERRTPSFVSLQRGISIHAPHARSDHIHLTFRLTCILFQSTLLMRGATSQIKEVPVCIFISIHAPHARSDTSPHFCKPYRSDFNPRSSCEERHVTAFLSGVALDFNPRSSCEEQPKMVVWKCGDEYFNPRSSCEERLDSWEFEEVDDYFNPRSSCEERQKGDK